MAQFLIRWFINAIGVYVATRWIPGVHAERDLGALLAIALILGLVNAFIRPILKFLTCPLIVLTLGLFTLVINALMLLLAAWIAQQVGLQFWIDGFWPAFLAAITISLVSFILTMWIHDERKKRRRW